MMITGLLVCVALLWIAVIGLVFVVLALIRQIGVLHERVAPVGALTVDQGPKVGDRAPVISVPTLNGTEILLGGAQKHSQMLFFLSPSCPICKKLLPVLRSLTEAEPNLEIILASDGEFIEHRAFYDKARLTPFKYALSADLGVRYRIPRLPYAVLISPEGVVRSKGLVNSREQLEGLLAADELGVASLQEYRARSPGNDRTAATAE